MTVEEFAQIRLYVEGAYNNFQISPIVWYDMLKDYDYKKCFEAVKNVIKIAKYPLSIAAVVEEYNLITERQQLERKTTLLEIFDEMKISGLLDDTYNRHSISEYESACLNLIYENKISRKIKDKIKKYTRDPKVLTYIEEEQLCLITKC